MKKALILLAALCAASAASAQKLVIKGSDTLGAKLVPTLKEAYVAKHPGVSFDIAAEGSTTGITAVIEGTANIGMSSRRATAVETSSAAAKGVVLKPTIVAYDGMAVIVHASNPIAKLSKRQVEQLFAGEVTDWSAIGGKPGKFSIYTRNTASGTYSDWKNLAMNKKEYASTSQKMAGNEQIVAEVSKNPNGVGYVGLAYIKEPGIKVIPIDGIMPTRENVLSMKYPYSRPTFYYTNGDPSGEAAKFIEFTASDEGRAICEQVGFVCMPKDKQ
jgi:phosphate transport system substrate-binding protein